MSKNMNVEKGKKGFQKTAPKAVSPSIPAGDNNASGENYSSLKDPKRPSIAPRHITLQHGSYYSIILSPNGEVYRKYFDEYGTIGRQKLSLFERWRLRKTIKEAAEEAWKRYDAENNASQEAWEQYKVRITN